MRRRCFPWLGGLALACAVCLPARAQERPDIIITDPDARTFRAAVQRFAPRNGSVGPERVEALRMRIVAALEYSGVFRAMAPRAMVGGAATESLDRGNRFVCSDWSQVGADALLEGEIEAGAGSLAVEYRVRDVARCKTLQRKRYRGGPSDGKQIAARIADDVVEAFTGLPGIAGTEIAFISDRSGHRELYVMDADGGDLRAVTRNGSINGFPSWSHDGLAILYTSYRSLSQPGLFLVKRGVGSPGRILKRLGGGGAQYRAVFHPESERVAAVVSVDGAPEIFTARLDGSDPRRLTHHRAIDIAPSWSPDGRRIAFVSDRAGSPQIYVMEADGGGVRRVTFNGSYNTAPSWSPDGRWIAYESRVGGQFDIWVIDPGGTVNVPLVSHPRSDEGPTWSPDGRKLAFVSTRRGRSDVYSIDLDGANLRRLTDGSGDDISPAWGPYRRQLGE